MNLVSLDKKNFLVTGASSGIDAAIATLLANLGARVILVARRKDELENLVSSLPGDGHIISPFDLTNFDQIQTWMKEIVAEVGPLDGLVHSAGIQITSPLRGLSNESFYTTMKINYEAAVWLTKDFRQNRMHNKGGSSIVYISSVAGMIGQKGNSIYGCSKAALISAAQAFSLELAGQKIRVNAISPALVQTELADNFSNRNPEQFQALLDEHPLGLGEPIDVANSVAFLLSDAAKWITGSNFAVDGGYTAGH
jgi:3-oxoacyl-[acyl-carrier protein] reductase